MVETIYEPLFEDDYDTEPKREYVSTSTTNYIFQAVLFLFLLSFFGVTAYLILIGVREYDVKVTPLHLNSTGYIERCSMKEKMILLHNFIRKMHNSSPIVDGIVVGNTDQLLITVRLMAQMNAISMNLHQASNLNTNIDFSIVILDWWWPLCDCAYTFSTGTERPNCSTKSFKTLVWDYENSNITIIKPSHDKQHIEIYYPYIVEEKDFKVTTKHVKSGRWEDFLTCRSKEKSLKVIRDYLDAYCY